MKMYHLLLTLGILSLSTSTYLITHSLGVALAVFGGISLLKGIFSWTMDIARK